MSASDHTPSPDSVRVWRGFRAESITPADFFARLGSVFIPATVEMQIQAGLSAYVPTVPAELPGKPATVPDETAILFWETQDAYQQGFERLAVRTYTLTHAAVYTQQSRADFPLRFSGELAFDQPYYLGDAPADWMHGDVLHLVGGRDGARSPDEFRVAVTQAVAALKRSRPSGALICLSAEYLVYWQLDGVQNMAQLTACCSWSEVFHPQSTSLPAGLWEIWNGMTVRSGDSFNMQFRRQWEQERSNGSDIRS
jgi:hypothetical protein